MIQSGNTSQLTFGIYPGGVAGTQTGLTEGPPDDPSQIKLALDRLQAEGRPLLVRVYKHFSRSFLVTAHDDHQADVTQYLSGGRQLDLVLCFRDSSEDLTDWLSFIRDKLGLYGKQLAKIQITEEPNLATAPGSADGGFPHVRKALVQGVVAAKEESRRLGLDVQVGFNAVPTFNPADDFWPDIGALGQQPFLDALDYVGLDCYPDVFRPFSPGNRLEKMRDAITFLLTNLRRVNLAAGKIPDSVPIHITENGWPTGEGRTPEKQAAVLEAIVRAVYAQRTAFNVTHYELFALRDGNSANPDLFHQFGILRDDYTPKPAFDTYRKLIAELGAANP
jgi:hypothetical protein